MLIGGLQKLTLIDYPGQIACVVFLIGCNFHCGYCYNLGLVVTKEIKKQPLISKEKLFQFLKERKGLLSGVVVSGGEPTIHKNLADFIRKIKSLDYLVKLDTNGSNPEILKKLIDDKLIDYVAMDIKAPFGVKNQGQTPHAGPGPAGLKYEQVSGVKINLEKIKKSIEIIQSSNIDHEFRTTLLSNFHTEEDIINIAQTIQGDKVYYLQNFKFGKIIDSDYRQYGSWRRKDIEILQKKCNQYIKTKIRD